MNFFYFFFVFLNFDFIHYFLYFFSVFDTGCFSEVYFFPSCSIDKMNQIFF